MKQHKARHRHPLRRWLQARGLNQRDFARLVNATDSEVSGVISGSLRLSIEKSMAWSIATGLPVEAFGAKASTRILKLYVEQQKSPAALSEETANVA